MWAEITVQQPWKYLTAEIPDTDGESEVQVGVEILQ